MLKRTHKVFALATVVGACVLYNHYTNSHITYDLLPELKHTYDFDTEYDFVDKSVPHLRELALSYFPFYMQFLFLLMGAVMGSEFPDLDHDIKGVVHRGWTHSIWVLAIPWTLTYIFSHHYFSYDLTTIMLPVILLGFSIGHTSHIIGDYFSEGGINLFYPIFGKPKPRKRVLGIIPTYKVGEYKDENDKIRKGFVDSTGYKILLIFIVIMIPYYLFTF